MAGRRTARNQSKPHPSGRSRQPQKSRRNEAKLAFETLTIEGGLLSPGWLARVAALEAASQSEADYRIPKGLQLRDEIGRYWRIAQAYWSDFAAGRSGEIKPETAQALSERFILALLRESFGFASLAAVEPQVIAERRYPIGFTALGGRVPVVIAPAGSVGNGLDILAPAFGDGGRRRSAFGLAQEYLNAAESATWGLATDGLVLRILRDNASLTRPAWIEADLLRIFTEERYADFAALWLLAHETRFGRADQASTECVLETWRDAGREEGTRAREHLRRGVEEALVALGQGFLENPALRAALQDGSLSTTDYFQELLRLVYRLIFLLTVEERGLLHPEGSSESARRLYAEGYGLRRLRERSIRRSSHDRFLDLWESTKIVFRGLAVGEWRLALPALAGIFAPTQCPTLDAAKLENRALLLAMFRLSWLREASGLARVNWRDMGPEELGSVYESLLELVPQVTQGGRLFAFATGGDTKGNARKTSGSYYTPDSLVQVLLDSALEPVVTSTLAANLERPVEALLELSVVDPACGSGHFLLAAARRLAVHVARLQANGTPSAAQYRHALRQVVGRCLYGVDLNPMAVELCKVSLWMEAVEPGLPLTFLDAHIRHGNALLGTTPELMAAGIPDSAWDPIEGDDRKVASALKKRNKRSGGGQRALDTLWTKPTESETAEVARAVAELEASSDTDVESLARKEERWEDLLDSEAYRRQKLVADTWCAAFVWPKQPGPLQDAAPTDDVWIQIRDRRGQPNALTVKTMEALAEQYQFFHWHLAFPQVFARGGFDVVLGNPPWEMPETDDRVFFSSMDGSIASEPLAAKRRAAIAELALSDPSTFSAWVAHSRSAEAQRAFARCAGRFPNAGSGRLNYSSLFLEGGWRLLSKRGRLAMVVPSGVTTNKYEELLWHSLLKSLAVVSVFDFGNEGQLFPAVDSRQKFTLITIGPAQQGTFLAACYLRSPHELKVPGRIAHLDLPLLQKLSPGSLAMPQFRDAADLRLLATARERYPEFGEAEGWSHTLRLMFSTSDSDYIPVENALARTWFRTNSGQRVAPNGHRYVPVYEGKMVSLFDHRAADIVLNPQNPSRKAQERPLEAAMKSDPTRFLEPQHWLAEATVIAKRTDLSECSWTLVFCDVTSATNERTSIPCVVPLSGLTRSLPAIYMPQADFAGLTELTALLSSIAADFFVRLRVATNHLTQGILETLPVPTRQQLRQFVDSIGSPASWWTDRILELTYTAWDLEPFARDIGYDGPPFRWDPERRFLLRVELDAAFFHLYGLSSEDTEYILDTFPIVRKNDEKAHREYRTKRVILEIYDAMAEAARTGQPYATRLDPPPADPRVAHPPRTGIVVAFPSRPFVPPAWGLELFAKVAALAQVGLGAGAWGTSLSGMDLGTAALAAVLRNLPGPHAREDVERAVVLTLLPRLMLPKFDSISANTWSNLIGSENLNVTSVGAFGIPWSVVIRKAIQQNVLSETTHGLWSAGPGVTDAPSPEFDARTLVVLSWLATAPAKDGEVTKQMENLHVA